jgi:hypothetical protein
MIMHHTVAEAAKAHLTLWEMHGFQLQVCSEDDCFSRPATTVAAAIPQLPATDAATVLLSRHKLGAHGR